WSWPGGPHQSRARHEPPHARSPPDIHPVLDTRSPLMTVHPAHTRVTEGDLGVPLTRVALTNGETFDRYCTSGPGSDPEVGLPRLREGWVEARGDTAAYDGRPTQLLDNGRAALRRGQAQGEWRGERRRPRRGDGPVTQMHYARRGLVTP